jgi:flotillin
MLFAQGVDPAIFWAGMTVLMVFIVFTLFTAFIKTGYKRCPSNRLLVIYGKTGPGAAAAKVIHGGGVFVIPVIQDYAYLSLEPISGDLQLCEVSLDDARSVSLSGKWTVAISAEPEFSQRAAVHLLGLTNDQIAAKVVEILEASAVKALREGADGGNISPAEVEQTLKAQAAEHLAAFGLQTHALSVRRIDVK